MLRRTRQLRVGDVPVGGGTPVSVQAMATTDTADVDATLQQIAAVTAAGCDSVPVPWPPSCAPNRTRNPATTALPFPAGRAPLPPGHTHRRS
ncbi:flavodoxin-dependent (E)-4-hydroxy-3-methylbut-2-enyl-diphosphate synthase [Streptomyces morookaense]|uniref:flavodoxin-dependent (E)-4-hydroxy-3-methylbut-2-enyl-diphosphate synthase n=1 Tax=Streptomyces morookaense TaxID=1970 RepID=UPI003F4CB978